jgi:hypothetical protein
MYGYVNSSVSRVVKEATMMELKEAAGKGPPGVLEAVVSPWIEMRDNGKELLQMSSAVKAAIMTGKLTWARVYKLSDSSIYV